MDPPSPSSAPPPPRASFASLPLELVKQIVALVHKQDKEYRNVVRAPHAEPSAYGRRRFAPEKQEKRNARVSRGVDTVWSYWYGHGISALSYVNKKLRSLSLPYLIETISTKQASAFFTLPELSLPPLAGMVRHVDLENKWTNSSLVGAAILHLQSARQLTLGFQNAGDLVVDCHSAPADQAQRALLRHAFASLAPRLKLLEVSAVDCTTAISVINLVACPTSLRVLRIESFDAPFENVDFRRALSRLSLKELSVKSCRDSFFAGVVPSDIRASWNGDSSMPTLKTLSVEANYLLPPPFLEYVAHTFPNVISLMCTLSSLMGGVPPESTCELSPHRLPHLERLTLAGTLAITPSFVQRLLHCLLASPLCTLTIERSFTTPADLLSTLNSLFPPSDALPPSLRRISVPKCSPAVRLMIEEEAARLAAFAVARGVRVDLPQASLGEIRHRDAAEARRIGRSDDGTVPEMHALARDSLLWALEHVDGLARAGDLAGLVEVECVCAAAGAEAPRAAVE